MCYFIMCNVQIVLVYAVHQWTCRSLRYAIYVPRNQNPGHISFKKARLMLEVAYVERILLRI